MPEDFTATTEDVTIQQIVDLKNGNLLVKATVNGLYALESYYTYYPPDQLEQIKVKEAVLDDTGHEIQPEETMLQPKADATWEQRLKEGAELNQLELTYPYPPSYADYTEEHSDVLLQWAKEQVLRTVTPSEPNMPDEPPIDLNISG